MINFNKLPIYLHQPSQVDISNLPKVLPDGIHYYVNVNCSAEQYIQLYTGIVSLLDDDINNKKQSGAGMATYLSNIDTCSNLSDFYLSVEHRDILYTVGYNPIISFVSSHKLHLFGNRFVYKNKSYPFYCNIPYRRENNRPNNLNIFASQYDAYIDEDQYRLKRERDILQSRINQIDNEIDNFCSPKVVVLENHLYNGI